MKYYCISTCDKCRLARKMLTEKKLPHTEIDMRKTGIEDSIIQAWIERYGLDTILNKRSATWRGLGDMQSQIENDPIAVIQSNPAMLFRPILDFGDHIMVSKAALNWLEEQ